MNNLAVNSESPWSNPAIDRVCPQRSSGDETPLLEMMLVDDLSTFKALKSDWNRLLANSSQETVFLSWEWQFTWWEFFATKHNALRILVFKHQGDIVGIAPFQLQTRGVRRTSILRFIGTGEPSSDQVVSEYLDVFANPEFEEQVRTGVISWIKQEASWSWFECENMKQDFLIWKIVSELKEQHLHEVGPKGKAYSISLSLPGEYRASLQESRQKRLCRSGRSLERQGGLVQHSISKPEDIAKSFDVLTKLHKERWQTKQQNGVFNSLAFNRFHLNVLQLLWSQGRAGIETFSLSGTPIASLYCLYTNSTAFYYQSGFAAQDANRYMPLAHAHEMEIERNIVAGRTCYDFLRGAGDSYKREYGCIEETLYAARLYRRPIDHFFFKLRSSVVAYLAPLRNRLSLLRK